MVSLGLNKGHPDDLSLLLSENTKQSFDYITIDTDDKTAYVNESILPPNSVSDVKISFTGSNSAIYLLDPLPSLPVPCG